MPLPFHRLLPAGSLGTFAALFCAVSGLSALSRWRRPSDVCVLTFHGLLDDTESESGLLDEATHTRVSLFTELCEHLAEHYHVISARELIRARRARERLPENSVVITFDDGYESNYKLAWPVLKRLKLPASIFLVSGYLDGEILPWFVRLEMALKRTTRTTVKGLSLASSEARLEAYGNLCRQIKDLPWSEAMTLLESIENNLGVHLRPGDELPFALRPMTWDMAREMQSSGLIDLGGHTHTHPVLGRCSDAEAQLEIQQCAERIASELGEAPVTFAYPNGRPKDFSPEIIRMLQRTGFQGAFSMVDAFVSASPDLFALPRYGSPGSRLTLEAMVSGIAQRLRQLRCAFTSRKEVTV